MNNLAFSANWRNLAPHDPPRKLVGHRNQARQDFFPGQLFGSNSYQRGDYLPSSSVLIQIARVMFGSYCRAEALANEQSHQWLRMAGVGPV